MCGISGFAGLLLDQAQATHALQRMCGAMHHRGPDGEGTFLEPPVALGMRRLSVIDITTGWQPMSNEDGQIQVIFNGEIYNYRLLRAILERSGHTFRTRSDTETIVHGYEEWGEQVFSRLRGMFAIAIWDGRLRRLILARDRLGIKPLYLWEQDGSIAFASELKSLAAVPGFQRTLDSHALIRYMALGYVPDPLCIFAGARKLPPGHMLTWTEGQAAVEHQWWSPLIREQPAITVPEAKAELRLLLEDAVSCHLEADVPLGAFLSGGVDSATVVAQMTRLVNRPVRSFSIGFSEREFDEAPDAARVAEALGTDHTEQVLSPDIDALLDDLVLAFDEPFADSSALPTWLVSKLAREHVTVALSGDGGDELFGGYTRYLGVHRGRLPGRVLQQAAATMGRRLPFGALGRNWLLNQGRSVFGRYAATVGMPVLIQEGGVVRGDLAGEEAVLEHLLAGYFDATAGRDIPARLALVDVLSYLPGDILTKVDRMSMRVSLEARVPLLDHHFAEFALSLPSHLKFRNGVGKWILREAVRDLVPAGVLNKPKRGFGVPLVHWLRGPLLHRVEALRQTDSPIYTWCDRAATHRILDEHLRGRRDHNTQIWRLLVLHLWLSEWAP